MEFFSATCQGIGLALAAGAVSGGLAGAAAARDESGAPGWALAALVGAGIVGGGLLFGASLAAEDHPAWPGWPVGALIALLAFSVTNGVVRGAATRAEGAPPATQVAYVGAAAAVLVVVSLFLSPLALVVLVGVAWLAVARRRRAQRKHEGLRVLR